MRELATSHWTAASAEPLLGLTVGDALRRAAAVHPERVAIVTGVPDRAERRRWTYVELLTAAENTAQALLARFRPGDRIAVWAGNDPEWILLEYGIALAGMTMVTVNPAYRANELRFVLARSRARGLFLRPEYRSNPMAETLESIRSELPELTESVLLTEWEAFLATADHDAALPHVDPEDPIIIMYTSGTTGEPKGVLQKHSAIVDDAHLTALGWANGGREINISPIPYFHTGGCVLAILGAVTTQATLVTMPQFDPALGLQLIEEERATTFAGVPTMFIAMTEHPDFEERDLSTLRTVGSGGAVLQTALLDRLESALGVRCINTFGQTECTTATMTVLTDSIDDRANTIGRPLPHVELAIMDPDRPGTIQSTGVIGEICVRGFSVMIGYDGLPDATAESIDGDGWLHTGDLGAMDARGYVTVEGRLKDLVIRGGENIYPREVEAVLVTHPAVGDAAVVGVPDPRWGEQLVAFVRATSPVSPEELSSYLRSRLSHYKVPAYWTFVDGFPLTPAGKIKKFELRDHWLQEQS